MAVADALDKCRYFVLGCSNLTVAVDHKPLLKIFSDRSLDKIPNNRLRNLKEKTLRYKFNIVYVPGATHRAADATSRSPTGPIFHPKTVLTDDVASTSSSSYESQLPHILASCRISAMSTDSMFELSLIHI